MGVLQRFERRLEGLVEGAFARVFKGVVEPVEVASALQRESADKKAIVGPGRTLVPNDYVVELGPSDNARLSPYAEPLGAELAAMVRENAEEQGWQFVGPVRVRFEQADLETGVFRVRSGVIAAEEVGRPRLTRPARPAPPQPTPAATEAAVGPGHPRLVVAGSGDEPEQVVELRRPVTVIGRSTDADVRLPDTGVSRRHAELKLAGDSVLLVDLGSTNGTTVNGRSVDRTTLTDGDRIQIGHSVLVFQRDDA